MSFSQITSVDLIVNQIVTIVTKYDPSSIAGINTAGDIVPLETVIKTSSNVGVGQRYTRSELANVIQTADSVSRFGNTTFAYSNQANAISTPLLPALELTNNNVGGQAVIAGAGLANGSVLLNGTGQYLTANTAATWTYLHNGLQDYTIECWYYSRATTYQNLLGTSGVTTSIGFELSINNPTVGAVTVVYTRGVSTNNTWTYANSAVTTGGWYHVATTFASSTKRSNIYVNGNLAGTAANVAFGYSASAPTNTLGIGFTPVTANLNGQITNVRITKSIVYTANFTPTIPLTNISNTQLLLQFNSSGALLTDSSSNNNTITNVGVATYSTIVPPLTSTVAAVNNYYNYSRLYFNGGLNIPYGDITSNVLASGSPVNTYTNPTGAMLNPNASILTTGTVSKSGVYDIPVSITAISPINYITPQSTLNQRVAYEFSNPTVSSSRYFVANGANVNSVTNINPNIIIVNAQPEFMLVNSDKNFVASNVNPTNYQTIEAVTPANDPRLASIKTGFIVKGQTGTNPYNPQNVY